MTLSLKVFNHADDGITFTGEHLLEGDPITVGRSGTCTLKLNDPEKRLSRVQVELSPAPGGYLLKVASQYFPVLVNGEARPPGSEVMIHAGDSIVMDVYELEIVSVGIENMDAPAAARTVAAPSRPSAAPAAPVRAPTPAASPVRSALPPAPPAAPPAAPSAAPSATPPAAPPAAPSAAPSAARVSSVAPTPIAPTAKPAPPAPAAPRAPAARPAMPAGLSATRLADLPGASAYQTALGGQGASVQIASLQVGHVLAGRFRVDEQIGAGGMGAVYRAHDALRNEDIALKVMLPGLLASEQAKQRFMNEAKIALRLRHPGIVSVYDVQADGAYLFLTMELLTGRTLRDAMEERKSSGNPWTEAEALGVIRPVCEALSYAHQYTVHRDVKPENVWLSEDGSVKLMDFGIARVLSGSQMTQTAAVMGTAYYMAPEQLVGARDVDHRADQYALGVMLYEMLTGRIPAGRIESLGDARPDLSDSLAQAADKALAGKVEERFATDTEFLAALNAPPGSGRRPLKELGRRTGLSAQRIRQIGIGATALAAVLLFALLWPVLKGLMPDHEAERKAEQEVARLDGEAKSLLKLVENDRKDMKEAAAAASREMERLEGQIRSARSPQERSALEVPLREARDKASVNAELDRRLRERAEGPNGVPKAEGNMNAAGVAMKGKDRAEATRLLSETVTALKAIRDASSEDRMDALAEQKTLSEQRRREELQIEEARARTEAEGRVKAQAQAQVAAAARAKDEAAMAAVREKEEAAARKKAGADARYKAINDAMARVEAEAKAKQGAAGKAK